MKTLSEAASALLIFSSLILAAAFIDALLHLMEKPDAGRIMGYWGTGLLVASFAYSARKRKWITRGRPSTYLKAHEVLSWVATVLIIVHGGVHFNALLPWLAMAGLVIAAGSGVTGKYLIQRARGQLSAQEKALRAQDLSDEALEQALYWDALVVDAMRKWRMIHIPIMSAFTFLAILHIFSILLFWRW